MSGKFLSDTFNAKAAALCFKVAKWSLAGAGITALGIAGPYPDHAFYAAAGCLGFSGMFAAVGWHMKRRDSAPDPSAP